MWIFCLVFYLQVDRNCWRANWGFASGHNLHSDYHVLSLPKKEPSKQIATLCPGHYYKRQLWYPVCEVNVPGFNFVFCHLYTIYINAKNLDSIGRRLGFLLIGYTGLASRLVY